MPTARSYVTIVTGMPRSGTSLTMRMLDTGGIPALTDGRRQADLHNPHGYFEDSRAARLAQESAWLEEACGMAVKIIYRLLPDLPPHLDYRVLFMERDLEEVFDSQQDMLLSNQHSAAGQDRTRMIRALAADLEQVRQWLSRQANIRCLNVPYAELIASPAPWVSRISHFLDGGLNEPAMAAVVDPALYRHRR
jgi:hypothetical protein